MIKIDITPAEVKEAISMPQQLVNGSHYKGSVTITNRQSDRYAVVNPPEEGKHRKTEEQRKRRHFLNQLDSKRRPLG